jgi:integrase
LSHKLKIASLSDGYLDELASQLDHWGSFPGFQTLDTFTQEDVEAFLAAVMRGEFGGHLVNKRDERGKVIYEKDEHGVVTRDAKGNRKPVKVRVVRESKREATRNRHLAALKSLMSWAREQNPPLTRNIADTYVQMGREDRDTRPPEPVEQHRWSAVGSLLKPRLLAIQTVLLGAGLRYSELSRLKEEDILPRGLIVRKAKRRKGRTVPVSEATVAAARALLNLGGAYKDLGRTFNEHVLAACKKLGLKPYTAHHLRHTYGTTCLRNGMDIRTLQVRLGHQGLKATLRYLHALRATDGDDKDYAPI